MFATNFFDELVVAGRGLTTSGCFIEVREGPKLMWIYQIFNVQCYTNDLGGKGSFMVFRTP